MAQSDNYKRTGNDGGMDTDSAYEDIAPEDAVERVNFRNTGTQGQQLGYDTNIESTVELTGSLLPGLNNIIGGGKFDDTGQIVGFRYNSAGNCQIILYSFSTNTYSVIYTDVTDSAGQTLLPLNPQNQVTAILINKLYLIWWAKDLEVGYCNLQALASGGYGTVLWEDLSLLKPQCPFPILPVPNATTPDIITYGYGSDLGQPANFLYSKLPQFIVQGVNADFNYTAWSTRSKRFTPYQENTPSYGILTSQNNYIVVAVYLWSIRLVTINVATQFDDSDQFYIIKSVDTAYIYALPNTAVDVSTEIYEAYNPTTSTYYFVFYNNTVTIPVNPNETDLLFDYIYPSNSGAQLNGNIPALGDWNTLYPRPVIPVTIAGVGYNPNIAIPTASVPSNPLKAGAYYPGGSGSGAGNHRRIMYITLYGNPNTGDVVVIIDADIRNASATLNYSYTVPSAQAGNLFAVVQSISETLGGSYFPVSGGGYQITWADLSYYGLQTFSVELYFAGASVANSIPTCLDNCPYKLAIGLFDYKMRPFPLIADNSYIISLKSYAQQNGNATQISITINTTVVPQGAVYGQLLITKPPVNKVLDVISSLLNYKGGWDARTNTPGLSINSGNIGDTYQITTPAGPTNPSPYYTNLGNNATYNTGDYITNIGGSSGGAGSGQYYEVVPRTFGNLSAEAGGILVFSLNSLSLLNAEYSQDGVSTNLVYDFAQGDRCTLHYWIDSSGNINYFNQPCIDLLVLGYDAGTYLVKVENSAALTFSDSHIYYNGNQIDARNIFMRLYSPAPQSAASSTAINETEWFEIGEIILISNGTFPATTFTIVDGGAYYKTRQFPDAILPYANPPVSVLATDLNYSDFYPSAYYSYGRVRTYYDILEKSEQQALIITGQPYVLGSKINGLNRFYPANIYGNNNGQCSSSQGGIQVMWQRGQELLVFQELGIFKIPVNEAYTVLNDQLTGQSISSVLLNNGRYDLEGVGIGLTKCFCTRYSTAYFIDPNKSLPYRFTTKAEPISGKMTKFFQNLIQSAYAQGKQINMYYSDYYEEAVLTIQAESGQLFFFPFSLTNWNPLNNYIITGGNVSATPNGSHSTASYNAGTGVVTYTPTSNYIGNDVATFTFTPPGGLPVTLNNCLNWIAGVTTVNPFSYTPVTGAALSTNITSLNNITVSGPNVPVPISITGPGAMYSINGGAFTNVAGTTNANDVIQVEVTSSGSNSTSVNAVLTIGTTSGTFTVTTLAASVGNYSVYSTYNVNISGVNNGTCTGTPAALNTLTMTNGQSINAVYTAVAAGTVIVTYSGTPAVPGHTYFALIVGGTVEDTQLCTGGRVTLTFSTSPSDPTTVAIDTITM